MLKKYIALLIVALTPTLAMSEEQTCQNLPSLVNLDCQDSTAVYNALNDLQTCMEKRFTFTNSVHSESWPIISVPETGKITGGDGEWAIACMQDFPCKDKRLAFLQKKDELPYLIMVSGSYIVDFHQDEVCSMNQLPDYSIVKISGLKPDDPWFKVN